MTRIQSSSQGTNGKTLPAPGSSLPARLTFRELSLGLLALDQRLALALAAAEQAFGSQAAGDPFRGLYLSGEDIDRLVQRAPGEAMLSPQPEPAAPSLLPPGAERLEWLRRRFALDDFDLQALWIALAPEVELRYERIYAYLQDDVTRKRPSLALIFDLLGATAEQRLGLRAHFSPAAPLLHSGLARLEAFSPGASPTAGLLASALLPDESLVRFLLGPDGPDPRLSEICAWLPPQAEANFDALMLEDDLLAALQALSQAPRLLAAFQGQPGNSQHAAAKLLAAGRGQALCHANAAALLDSRLGLKAALELLLRSGEFNHALILISGADALLNETILHRALAESQADVILSSSTAWQPHPEHPLGVTQLIFEQPKPAARRAGWQAAAAAHGLELDEALLEELSQRFRLLPGQVRNAASMLAANGRLNTRQAWLAAARLQSGQALQAVAQKITPRQGFADLVLPPDSLAQLHEMAARVSARELVLENWGFGRRMTLGRGVTALFAGPPGTGKTMAAEVVASELGLDLYRIDLARVVSKYIGETEKNLNAVFAAAEDSNAILFFDEADALFGRRSEVQDAHDRYANIEVAYLLQKMEQYEGAAILATNLRQNLDEAFMRRLSFVINFPFPDQDSRRLIWQGIWPEETPLDGSLDFAWLAQRFRLSGGNIRNIALAAAYLAAHDGGIVTTEHLLLAVRREFNKMGKTYPETERAESL